MAYVQYKTARQGTLRAASVSMMHRLYPAAAATVIAAIAALPGFDKGKARSHYFWCGANGFAPYHPAERERQKWKEEERQGEASKRESQRRQQEEQDRRRNVAPGKVSAEAREILGIKVGATLQEIDAAYKRLMRRVHPDVGGTDFFAKQLNNARDVLLREAR
jgi:hypothetical protein